LQTLPQLPQLLLSICVLTQPEASVPQHVVPPMQTLAILQSCPRQAGGVHESTGPQSSSPQH
jgi:hypothetical protein